MAAVTAGVWPQPDVFFALHVLALTTAIVFSAPPVIVTSRVLVVGSNAINKGFGPTVSVAIGVQQVVFVELHLLPSITDTVLSAPFAT